MSLLPRNSNLDFDNFFDHFFAPSSTSKEASSSFFSPRVDLKENDDHYEITAELPGVKKDDIHVTLDNGVLTIEAENKQEDKEEKDGKIIRQERRYGKFVRSFTLGSGITEQDISASFTDGVLKLKTAKPKQEPIEKRRIHIG